MGDIAVVNKRGGDSIPALILGTGITALGVIRSLSTHGIKCYSVGRQNHLVRASRWYNNAPISDTDLCPKEALHDYLRKLPFDRAVVMPCGDRWTRMLSALPEELRSVYKFSLPDENTVDRLMNKASLSQILKSANVPHPSTLILSDESDLKSISKDSIKHTFLKPTDSEVFFRKFQVKAFQVASYEDAVDKYRRIHSCGMDVVYQEYIPGPASNHYFIDGFVDRHGIIRASFARHRFRMYPPDFGNSSYMKSIPIEEVSTAHEALKRLLNMTGYRGIFSAEFKLDPRDNEFKLLEINVRPWWYIWFAERCRVPIAMMAYLDSLEMDVKTIENYRTDYGLIYPYYDFSACMQMMKNRELSIVSWLKSWLTSSKANFFIRDPIPSIIGTLNWLIWFIRHRIGSTRES